MSEIKEDVQKVFGESEHLLEDANELSNNIKEELQVLKVFLELLSFLMSEEHE